jgi:hypothetical protein
VLLNGQKVQDPPAIPATVPLIPLRFKPAVVTLVRAAVVAAASMTYLSHVFQLGGDQFWKYGLGDWMDPYFINALLEHWYHSFRTLGDPSSPPMFFPVAHTLGYSHGLVLYAPFYIPLRIFLHPFHAYTVMLLAVIEAGIVCLYVVFRRLGLSFVGSLLLCAFFLSCRNVINGETGVWSQRASVFLIPPILLLLLVSFRMRPGPPRLMLAAFSGWLATLMYVQDFYTAHFAVLIAAMFGVAGGWQPIGQSARALWTGQPRKARWALILAAAAGGWSWVVAAFGGIDMRLAGVRLASHDWRRPGAIAVIALAAFFGFGGRVGFATGARRRDGWTIAVAVGACAGALVFLWIYLGAYREHPVFPAQDLRNALLERDPSRWTNPTDILRDFHAYRTLRTFLLVLVATVLAWVPRIGLPAPDRRRCAAVLAISCVVLLLPLSFNGISVWTGVFAHLPGFGVIRDPKRVIPLFELAVVVATALLIGRLAPGAPYRVAMALLLLVLLIADPNPEVFDYERPIDLYQRWVAAPVAVDPACRTFFVKPASGAYRSRSAQAWSLYGVDAMFVSLNHSIPTLNGYSAWAPDGWTLQDPNDPAYPARVTAWIERFRLSGVCAFDIDARTMTMAGAPLSAAENATDSSDPCGSGRGACGVRLQPDDRQSRWGLWRPASAGLSTAAVRPVASGFSRTIDSRGEASAALTD